MIRRADMIVIGSGGLGAATAFYLVTRGARNVALVDKHDIGSQTSPRAAGMVSCVRKGELMMELIKLAAAKIKRFTQDTGQPLDWFIRAASKSRADPGMPKSSRAILRAVSDAGSTWTKSRRRRHTV
jgi:glycine/D-amino acid oxidase-like deaminating enzyme